MDPLECLFGEGDGISEPWHAYHKCICREVNQSTLDFLHLATGSLEGFWHDSNGWILDLSLWNALVLYVQWCNDNQLDFQHHISQVLDGDVYYTKFVGSKLTEFGA